MSLKTPTELIQCNADAEVKVLPTVESLLPLPAPITDILRVSVNTVIGRASGNVDPCVSSLAFEELEDAVITVETVRHLGRQRHPTLGLSPLGMGKRKEPNCVVDNAVLRVLNHPRNVDCHREAFINAEHKEFAVKEPHGFASSFEEGGEPIARRVKNPFPADAVVVELESRGSVLGEKV